MFVYATAKLIKGVSRGHQRGAHNDLGAISGGAFGLFKGMWQAKARQLLSSQWRNLKANAYHFTHLAGSNGTVSARLNLVERVAEGRKYKDGVEIQKVRWSRLNLFTHYLTTAPFGVRLAGILGLCVFGGFWLSASTISLYGGALTDKGGVPPILGMDANIVVFSLAAGFLLARGVPKTIGRTDGQRSSNINRPRGPLFAAIVQGNYF